MSEVGDASRQEKTNSKNGPVRAVRRPRSRRATLENKIQITREPPKISEEESADADVEDADASDEDGESSSVSEAVPSSRGMDSPPKGRMGHQDVEVDVLARGLESLKFVPLSVRMRGNR